MMEVMKILSVGKRLQTILEEADRGVFGAVWVA
jgi:hypothetical protein